MLLRKGQGKFERIFLTKMCSLQKKKLTVKGFCSRYSLVLRALCGRVLSSIDTKFGPALLSYTARFQGNIFPSHIGRVHQHKPAQNVHIILARMSVESRKKTVRSIVIQSLGAHDRLTRERKWQNVWHSIQPNANDSLSSSNYTLEAVL